MSVAHLLPRHPPAFSSRENACIWGTNFQLVCLQSLRPIILNQTIDPIIIGAVNPYQRRPLTWLRRENVFWFKLVLDSSAIRALEGKISRWSVINHPVIAFLHDETFYSVIIGVVHPYQRQLLAWSRWENVFRFYFGLKFLRHPRVWGTNFQLVGLQSLRPRFLKTMKNHLPDNHGCCTSVPTPSVAWSRRENVFWINFGLRFLRHPCVWGTNFQVVSLQSLRPSMCVKIETNDTIIMGVVHPHQRRPLAWSRWENVFWFQSGLRFLRCLCVWGTNFQLVSLPSLRPRFPILWNDLCVFMGVVHPYQRHPLAWSRRENVFWINFGLRFLRRPCVWGTNFQLVGLQSLRPRFLIHGCCTSVPMLSVPRLCPENVFWFNFGLRFLRHPCVLRDKFPAGQSSITPS